MTRAVSTTFLGTEFDNFLFAPIGEDGNGMHLSVLSALARLDLDPWREAAELDDLPGERAIQRLASLIASLPDAMSVHRDPGKIAARVIGLLPHGATAPAALPARDGMTRFRPLIYGFLVFVAVMIGAQLVLSSNRSPATYGPAPAHSAAPGHQIPQHSGPQG